MQDRTVDLGGHCPDCNRYYERRAGAWACTCGRPADTHSDDAAVDRFAVAMKAKMARSRAKGRTVEWTVHEAIRRWLHEETAAPHASDAICERCGIDLTSGADCAMQVGPCLGSEGELEAEHGKR